MKRRRTRTQREVVLRCFKLLEVRFDCYVVALWMRRCIVTFEARS